MRPLQQRVFHAFVQMYNEVWPHEALNDDTPASRWHPSTPPVPTRVTPPSYPGPFQVRRVSRGGTVRLHNGQQFLSQAFNEEMIGLKEIDDGIWNVLYYQTLLGRFDERTRTITGAPSLKKDCSPCLRTKCHLSSRLFSRDDSAWFRCELGRTLRIRVKRFKAFQGRTCDLTAVTAAPKRPRFAR